VLDFPALLQRLAPRATEPVRAAVARGLFEVLPEAEIHTPLRLAHFLAQGLHETQGLTAWSENLSYSSTRLMQVWPRRFPTLEIAQQYARRPEKLANFVYADRLGNGPPASNDGWRFRGRGLPQLTGRANYALCGPAAKLDLIADPDQAADPFLSVRIMGAFWRLNGLNAWADRNDLAGLTLRFNGGDNGLPDRRARFAAARIAIADLTRPN